MVCHALAVSCNIQDVTNIQGRAPTVKPFNENNNLTILLNKNKN